MNNVPGSAVAAGTIQNMDDDPVCVVGMACRLPGDIRSPSDLWDFLVEGKSAQGPIPVDRFNATGVYSESPEVAGVMNIRGGYFINDDVRAFDNAFFGINNLEATYMDPQQRKLLEVVYECFENAGISKDDISSSNTGVYVGNFTHDYYLMQMREPDYLHRYHGTGSGTTLLANRISHVFNLHGPSFTIDTACSSSIHCLHAAVSALKAGECDGAVVAACNLILTPEPFVAAMKTGVLSSSATCQTFDEAADGYGRAEGVDAVYLKRLSAAIRDGDQVFAVIRGTAINSNGRTPGVTLPSADLQEAVIRKAYTSANIDFNGTDYVECHGTGTAVGDPIEVEALGRCFSSKRHHPLMIGSVKSNIGHSEASSGLTSLIKVSMAFRNDGIPPMIPPEHLNPKSLTSETSQVKLDNMQIVTKVEKWPRTEVRRASINSFGYGGANAHAIIESIDSFMGANGPEKDGVEPALRSQPSKLILPVSAASPNSLDMRAAQISELAQYSDRNKLERLAYTLASHTPHLKMRTYLVASVVSDEPCEIWTIDPASENVSIQSRDRVLPIAYVFTGQGAQYTGMARGIMGDSPVFLEAIRRQDRVLRSLNKQHAPGWTLEDTICQTDDTVALVEELRSYGIAPSAVIGHSSGEIAAAYAAGMISGEEAIIIAYFRGMVVEQVEAGGAMMAVGLDCDSAKELIANLGIGDQLGVACVNSPVNTTLSGKRSALDAVANELLATGKFCRFIETGGQAYHSPLMKQVGELYQQLLDVYLVEQHQPETPGPSVYSTVAADGVGTPLPPMAKSSYWRMNLERPVHFSSALTNLTSSCDYHLLEIGPHPSLKAPIRQTLSGRSLPYTPTLARGEDSSLRIKKVAGELFRHGYRLAWDKINLLPPNFQCVTDIVPPYPWDYSQGLLWFESRGATEMRNRRFPRHVLLGSLQPTGNGIDWTWRNSLRLKEVPWIADHRIEEQIVFPAAGFIALAIEAISQIRDFGTDPTANLSLEFQNVSLSAALVLADTGETANTELHTTVSARKLSARHFSKMVYEFSVSSWKSGQAVLHCSGSLLLPTLPTEPGSVWIPDTAGHRTWAMGRWYKKAAEEGLVFGPRFQSIVSMKADSARLLSESICITHAWPSEGELDEPPRDTIAAAGNPNRLRPYLPVFIPHCVVRPSALTATPGTTASIHVRSHKTSVSTLQADCTLRDVHGEPLVDMRGVKLSMLDSRLAADNNGDLRWQRHPVMRVHWKPDVFHLNENSQKGFEDYVSTTLDQQPSLDELIGHESPVISCLLDLLGHKNPRLRVLDLGAKDRPAAQAYRTRLDGESDFPRYASWDSVVVNNDGKCVIPGSDSSLFDVLLQDANPGTLHGPCFDDVLPRLGPDVAIIIQRSEPMSDILHRNNFEMVTLHDNILFARHKGLPKSTEQRKSILILIREPSIAILKLADALSSHIRASIACNINIIALKELSDTLITGETICVSLLETEREFLATMSQEDMKFLRVLTSTVKDLFWITGAKMLGDPDPNLTLASGLARSLMMERPSLNFTILDIGSISLALERPELTHLACDGLMRIMTGKGHRSIEDKEFIQHNGVLYISRLGSDAAANNCFRRRLGLDEGLQMSRLADVPFAELSIDRPGAMDTIYFSQENEGFIDVAVQAVSLNAKDVYTLSGRAETRRATKSLEFAGVVVAAGPPSPAKYDGTADKTAASADILRPGDRVLVCAPSRFALTERVPVWQAHRLLPGEDSTIMASLPVAWGAALYALRNVARLRAGEHILVHSGAGAFGTAVVRLAQRLGAVVYATAGSARRRAYLVDVMGLPVDHVFSSRNDAFARELRGVTPGGRGVDVVVNSLVGDLLHAGWRVLAKFGRFVEVGKRELLDAGRLDMDVFSQGATFTAFDITDMLYHDDPYYREVYIGLVKEVLSMYRSGQLEPAPITTFDVSNIAKGYRYFSSPDRVGKIVISFTDPESRIPVMSSKYSTILSAHKSYLLVGCLGGLGRSLSNWMLARGARNFVFLGRSGRDKPEAQEHTERLTQSGARVSVVRGDVSNMSHVESALVACRALGPVGGVVHAAMGLHEDLFERMSHEGWHVSVQPKWRGAWNIDRALVADNPDFFLLTSSMTGTVGVATESNYCAANAFLDAFAYWRSRRGSPTVSIGLGMVSEVGYLHENPKIEALLLRRGIQPLDEDEFLQVVDLGISGARRDIADTTATSSHMLTGMETIGVRKLLEQGFAVTHTVMDDQRSSILSAALESNHISHADLANGSNDTNGCPWARGIPSDAAKCLAAETGVSSLREAIDSVVCKRFSNLILMSYDKINFTQSFAQFGVDSMIASEFRTWFWNTFKVDIPFLDFLSSDRNLETLSSVVETKLLGLK
ncbi:polyketide synthase [Apiospora kogelbergensis]|uniref:polyketide synthase n=1 Tax=Apiospora kogelbergensis TaxID=1337665 RepID=UPI0031323F46